MKRYLITAALAAGLCAPLAEAKRNKDVAAVLKERYPDAKTEIVGTSEVNGVKVNDVKITTKDGQSSTAQVTEHGDFMLYSEPREGQKQLSKQAMQTVGEMFKSQPNEMALLRTTEYHVDMNAPAGKGKTKTNRLVFDPTGRLTGIVAAEDVRATEDFAGLEKASKDEGQKAADFAKKYVGEDAEVQAIYKAAEGEDFYVVDMVRPGKKDVRMTLNNDGRVYSAREQVDQGELPPPVAQAIDQLFKKENMQRVYRNEVQFYEFDQKAPGGGGAVTVRMRPNGDIVSIENDEVEEQERAVTAKHKQKG
jgi:hypothetical protein